MRRIVPILAAALSTLAAPSVGALAATPKPADTQARLVACDTTARSLTVEGTMRSLGKGDVLQMRFALQRRDDAADRWVTVTGPGLDTWSRARAGVARYRFRRRIENLPAPAVYRVIVRYRWLVGGRTVAATAHTTARCVQPDPRAGLSAA